MSGSGIWTTLTAQFRVVSLKLGVLFLLAIVLVVVLVRQWSGGPDSLDAALPVAGVGVAAPNEPPARPAASERPPLPELPREAARDLFSADWTLFGPAARIGGEETAGDADNDRAEWRLNLTLTMLDGRGGSSAVINGRCVGVGDSVEGATVESITAREVVLSTSQMGRMVLRME